MQKNSSSLFIPNLPSSFICKSTPAPTTSFTKSSRKPFRPKPKNLRIHHNLLVNESQMNKQIVVDFRQEVNKMKENQKKILRKEILGSDWENGKERAPHTTDKLTVKECIQ